MNKETICTCNGCDFEKKLQRASHNEECKNAIKHLIERTNKK